MNHPTGNVFEPRGLDELIPDWKERDAPIATPVMEDSFGILTETEAYNIPNFLLPPQLVRFRDRVKGKATPSHGKKKSCLFPEISWKTKERIQ